MADLEITGLRKEFGGVIALAGVDISIQSDRIVGIIGPNGSGKTTLFNVIAGVHKPTSGRVLSKSKWDSPEAILNFVGLATLGDEIAGALPFGNLRRLGVAIALGANPSLLLLDEPAAGLSHNESDELMELVLRLPKMGIGVCLIDHDMFLMSALCERLVVLNFGTKIAEGPPKLVLNDPKVTEVYLGNEL